MSSSHLLSRLTSLQDQLVAHYQGRSPSSASIGREREEFIHNYLAKVLPPVFRFGSGEAIDSEDGVTGQLDIVVEFPMFPSLPQPNSRPRLYPAEGVAAVIEVKSDLEKQWEEVIETADRVKQLQRHWGGQIFFGDDNFTKTIPVFAVGYTGWKKRKTLLSRLEGSSVDAILVINPGIFVANDRFKIVGETEGPWALWAFIASLHQATEAIKILQAKLGDYAL